MMGLLCLRSGVYLLPAIVTLTASAVCWDGPSQSIFSSSIATQTLSQLESAVTTTASLDLIPASAAVLQLLKRQDASSNSSLGNVTCGWLSGYQNAPITCSGGRFCFNDATKMVHGCCKTNIRSLCSIATTCIASSDLSVLCTDSGCSDNSAIQKCFLAQSPECATHYYSTSDSVFTGYGCATKAYSATILSTSIDGFNSTTPLTVKSTASIDSSQTASSNTATNGTCPTLSPSGASNEQNPNLLSGGGIAGVVLGTLIAIALFANAGLLLIKRTRKDEPSYHDGTLQDQTNAIPYHDYSGAYTGNGPNDLSTHGASPAPYSEYSEMAMKGQTPAMHELPARGSTAIPGFADPDATVSGTPAHQDEVSHLNPQVDEQNESGQPTSSREGYEHDAEDVVSPRS